MNKTELLASLTASRTQFEDTLTRMSPDQMLAPDVVGVWSVKDALAHLAMWASRCVTLVYSAEQGQPGDDVDAMFDQWETLNSDDYESQKDRALDLIMADFRGVHRQLMKRLTAWDEASLFDRNRYAWLRGQSVGQFVLSQVAEHEEEHQKQIALWLSERGG